MPSAPPDESSFVTASPLGRIEVVMRGDAVAAIRYLDARASSLRGRQARRGKPQTRAARDVEEQLRRYFDNPHRRFKLKLALDGTPFQQRVWKRLVRIPPGKPLSYGELARRLGTGPRAVGGACRANPVPIVIPCHRVVTTSGVGGYCGNMRGKMQRAKRWLLRHEGAEI